MKLISHHDNNILLEHLINDYTSTKQQLGAFGEYTIAVLNESIQNWLEQKLVEKIGICSVHSLDRAVKTNSSYEGSLFNFVGIEYIKLINGLRRNYEVCFNARRFVCINFQKCFS